MSSSQPVTLITGGAGFLGSHLCDRLLAEGHRVVAMDNLLTGNLDNIAHLRSRTDFEFIHHNVTTTSIGPANWTTSSISPRRPARSTTSNCRSRP